MATWLDDPELKPGTLHCAIDAMPFDRALVHLSTCDAMRDGNLNAIEREALERAVADLGAWRASIWRLRRETGVLVCTNAFDTARCLYSSGPCIPILHIEQYITELKDSRCISAPGGIADKRLIEWAAFMEGDHAHASLHAPIRSGGEIAGILWIDDGEEGRQWTKEERAYIAAITDILSETTINPASENAQDLMLASRDRFLDLIDNALDMMFVLDRDGRLISANPVSIRELGYSYEELMRMPLRELITNDQVDEIQPIITEIIDGKRDNCTVELDAHTRSGEIIPIEVKLWPVSKNGQTLAVQGIARNILERRTAQEQRNQLERQLFQAQRLESVGRLAGGVAHDFNNILTAVIGSSELALRGMGEDHPEAPRLQEAIDAAQRAAALVRHLLAFSRKQVLQPRVLNLVSVVEELKPLLFRVIGEDIDLQFEHTTELPTIKADPAQLEQVIVNLAVNSRDAMQTGGRLTIETTETVLKGHESEGAFHIEPGPYVCLRVTDNGCGMDEVTQLHAFEPFFTTKSNDGNGTGLGLSTVYGIVKQSGGYIFLESQSGKGTTFRIYLPTASAQMEFETLDSKPDMDNSAVGSETILIVEDDDALRTLTSRILTRHGYVVFEATNGEEALEVVDRIKSRRIDLLLTDVVMPRMGGPELAQALTKKQPAIRVLFMTGYARDIIDQNGTPQSTIPLVQKPFTLAQLTDEIRATLDR